MALSIRPVRHHEEKPIDRTPASRATQLCSLTLFLLPAMSLTTQLSVGLTEAILLLAAVACARHLWQQRADLFGSTGYIGMAIAFNLLAAGISLAATGFDPSYLENPIKMLLAVLAIGMVVLWRPQGRYFWFGLLAGTVGALLFAAFQRFYMHMPRAEGFSMPITFGDLAMVMGLMALASIQQFSRTRWTALPYLAFVAGVTASILSGSRGGWLAVLLLLVPVYVYGRQGLGRRMLLIGVASIGLLGAASVVPQTGVRERVLEISEEITAYHHGNPDTSVGARLEMWKGAWIMFTEHPLTGVGRANFNPAMLNLIARGRINPAIDEYHHAHNEFLNALATEGLPGGLALLFLYGAPLLFFVRQMRQAGPQRPYALAGVLLVLAYIDFGLTQVMFAHHVSGMFFALTTCALVGLCLQAQRAAAATGFVSGAGTGSAAGNG